MVEPVAVVEPVETSRVGLDRPRRDADDRNGMGPPIAMDGRRNPAPCRGNSWRMPSGRHPGRDPSRYEETDRGKPRSVVRTADPWSFHSPGSEGGSTRCSVQTSEYPGSIPRGAPSHTLPHLANAPCVHSRRRLGPGVQPTVELLLRHRHPSGSLNGTGRAAHQLGHAWRRCRTSPPRPHGITPHRNS